jgi:hypothetical protein
VSAGTIKAALALLFPIPTISKVALLAALVLLLALLYPFKHSQTIMSNNAVKSTLKLALRPSSQRGNADHGWLQTYHTCVFAQVNIVPAYPVTRWSFASYFDPSAVSFGPLRVLNEDLVKPSTGYVFPSAFFDAAKRMLASASTPIAKPRSSPTSSRASSSTRTRLGLSKS